MIRVLSSPADPAGPVPALWFDLTDLAAWSGPLTGIQRVMAGLARACLAAGTLPATAPDSGRPIRFCYYKRDAGFLELPREAAQVLLAGLGTGQPLISGKGGGLLIGAFRRKMARPRCPFAPGDAYFYAGIVTSQAKLRLLDETLAALAMPMVVIVHDVIPLMFREWCKVRTYEMFQEWFGVVARRATLVLTPSENTRRDVAAAAAAAGLPCPPVVAVPLPQSFEDAPGRPGGGQQPGSDAGGETDRAAAGAAEAAALPAAFALYVSTIEPRKNHRLLFYLWKRLLAEHGAAAVPDLVFLGKRGWQSNDFVSEMTNAAFLGGKIRWLPAADDALLAAAYRRCRFTLFPSFYEGFGLPVAESLGFGRPCLASNQASIPEVGGDLVDYFDPYELSQAHGLASRAIFDETFLAARRQRIRERFTPSTWSAYAEDILAQTARSLSPPPAQPSREQ
jgi:glycosyltransferase involved in cell wall biosynthesis